MVATAFVITFTILMVIFLAKSYRKEHKPLPAHMVNQAVTLTPAMMTAKAYAGEDHGEVLLARKSALYRHHRAIMRKGTRGIDAMYHQHLSSAAVQRALKGLPTPQFRVVKTHTTQGNRLAGSVKVRSHGAPMITLAHGATPMVVLHELAHYAVDGYTMCINGSSPHGHDGKWLAVYVDLVRDAYPGKGAEMFRNSLGVAA